MGAGDDFAPDSVDGCSLGDAGQAKGKGKACACIDCVLSFTHVPDVFFQVLQNSEEKERSKYDNFIASRRTAQSC